MVRPRSVSVPNLDAIFRPARLEGALEHRPDEGATLI